MPILWNYLLSQHLRVTLLCLFAFLGILLTARLDEVARFAAYGGSASLVLQFALLQIPYILPIALPVCCAIGAFLLFNRLSHSGELTSMRACGLSLSRVLAPVLLAGALCMVVNFYIISEVATRSHLGVRKLQTLVKTVNPMVLLQHRLPITSRGGWIDVLGAYRPGEAAEDVVLALPNDNTGRLHLLLAKELESEGEHLTSRNLTIFSSLGVDDSNAFDHLVIENMARSDTPISEFTAVMKKEGWKLADDHLQMGLLIARLRELYSAARDARLDPTISAKETHEILRERNKAASEAVRRSSLALAAFTFTLMGAAFGCSIGRRGSSMQIPILALLTTLFLAGFFTGKGMSDSLHLSIPLYLLPHAIITLLSVRHLKRISAGVGS